MKSKTKDPQQDPYKKEQNSKTNIGYENTPKKAKDTKGAEVKDAEKASVDQLHKSRQHKHEED